MLGPPMSAAAPALGPLLLLEAVPDKLHVPDLRTFFGPAIEDGLFSRFHFRRRRYQRDAGVLLSSAATASLATGTSSSSTSPFLCCLMSTASQAAAEQVLRSYNKVPWKEVLIDADVPNSASCSLLRLDSELVMKAPEGAWLEELHPPLALPRGNVGTPRQQILAAIRACRLPPYVVPRLGLVAPSKQHRSIRGFATVPPPTCWGTARTEPVEEPPTEVPLLDCGTPLVALPDCQPAGRPDEKPNRGAKPKPKEEAKPVQKVPAEVFKPWNREERAAAIRQGRLLDAGRESPDVGVVPAKPKRPPPESGSKTRSSKRRRPPPEENIEERHISRPLDTDPDVFDEPIEGAPHFERNDRLDSVAGQLHEDIVEDPWDKHEASGLVIYTDAFFWDRQVGGLDERCPDGWDVEHSDGESVSASSAEEEEEERKAPRPRAHMGLAGAVHGPAGRIMRRWGEAVCVAKPSSTLLAVVDGLQPNLTRTGLGWAKKDKLQEEWLKIGSVHDKGQDEEMKGRKQNQRGSAGPVRGSFRADPCSLHGVRKRRVLFVPPEKHDSDLR